MSGVARLGDKTHGSCIVHGDNIGGVIIAASSDVMANGIAVARLGDIVLADCGHQAMIITASPNVGSNNRGLARLGDLAAGDHYRGNIISASSDVFAN